MSISFRRTTEMPSVPKNANRVPAYADMDPNETTRTGVYAFAVAMFLIGFGVVFVVTLPWMGFATTIVAVVVGLLCLATFRVAPQWEKVAVMRCGKFNRIAGPGFFAVIPFFEYASIHIDHRTMVSAFSAEAALTADLVPVDVDAIILWLVWDAKAACLEVTHYPKAVLWSAQTALRDAIGQVNLADLSTRRKQIDREVQEVLGSKCEQWGITVMSVEIRDIAVPLELQDALSKEAQAERERNARVLLAEVEKEISEMLADASHVYDDNPKALQLRAMTMAYEGARGGKGVLLAPSSLADGFDLGKLKDNL